MYERDRGEVLPLVSIVMPLYNAAQYLPATLAAIQAQTYRNWELIVVDDASSDGSVRIVESAAQTDPRIQLLVHSTNQGPAGARNDGLALATGDYVWMPDADDAYASNLLEQAVEAIASAPKPPDAVIFGHVEQYFSANGEHLYDHALPMEGAAWLTPEQWHGLVPMWERGTHFGYVWNKLFRRSCIFEKKLRFENVRLIEDVLFVSDVLRDAQGLCVLGSTPYRYAKRQGSSLTNENAYGAQEFWKLHEQRLFKLSELFEYWRVFSDESRAILGSLYVRYVVSTLERSYHTIDRWSGKQRRAWLAAISETELYRALVPFARAEDSRALSLAVAALQRGATSKLLGIAWAAHFARSRAYRLFTRIRSER